MNLSQLLTTLVVVASSATGLVFADDLGIDLMDPMSGSHRHDDPCAAEDADDSADEDDAGNATDDNSTDDNETTSSSSSSSSGSSSNTTTSSGNSTTTGNQTGGSSSSTTTSSNSTADQEDAQEADCDEQPPAGNETAEDGNETAEPVEEAAEPDESPAAPPAPDCADVHIEDSGDDLLGEDQDWSWMVAANARHLSVQFDGSSGLGLGGSPDVTLVDGAGRVIASGDSGDGWGGLSVEQFGPLTPGLWRLSYESEGLLSGYWVTIDLTC